jgi:hypothetical protein
MPQPVMHTDFELKYLKPQAGQHLRMRLPPLPSHPVSRPLITAAGILQTALTGIGCFFKPQGSSTANVSLKRLVQLAKPTEPARTTI